MEKQARITSKGQITIPIDIRKAMGVGPGDSVIFEEKSGTVEVRAARKESPFAKYRGIGNPRIPSGRRGILKWMREFRGE